MNNSDYSSFEIYLCSTRNANKSRQLLFPVKVTPWKSFFLPWKLPQSRPTEAYWKFPWIEIISRRKGGGEKKRKKKEWKKPYDLFIRSAHVKCQCFLERRTLTARTIFFELYRATIKITFSTPFSFPNEFHCIRNVENKGSRGIKLNLNLRKVFPRENIL